MGEDTRLVVLELAAVDGGHTEPTLEHSGEVANDFWDQYGPGAVGIGWDMALFGLAEHLLPEPAVTPANAEAWMLSDTGKDFSRRSSATWRDASVAGGTAPEAADRAAANATAFYTGEPAS